jgi:preprotein translocase subunit YajC
VKKAKRWWDSPKIREMVTAVCSWFFPRRKEGRKAAEVRKLLSEMERGRKLVRRAGGGM